ncbi:MAG: MarR family winged helix-turn-helix transcriptional regulator [Christensenellales bacterium]|jgi:DNA-binding MarR family transcriptional regulator
MTHTDPSDAADGDLISGVIHRLDHGFYQAANRRLKQLELTMPQAIVLKFLHDHEGTCINQRAIEELMHISNPSVTSLMRNMEEKGLLVRRRDAKDARSYRIEITDYGRVADEKVGGVILESDRQLLAGLTEHERRDLRRVLQRMLENLEGAGV